MVLVGSISPSNYKTCKTYKTISISIPLVDNDNDTVSPYKSIYTGLLLAIPKKTN